MDAYFLLMEVVVSELSGGERDSNRLPFIPTFIRYIGIY